jgi:hypothetical protein
MLGRLSVSGKSEPLVIPAGGAFSDREFLKDTSWPTAMPLIIWLIPEMISHEEFHLLSEGICCP